jgi:hypothetical protein
VEAAANPPDAPASTGWDVVAHIDVDASGATHSDVQRLRIGGSLYLSHVGEAVLAALLRKCWRAANKGPVAHFVKSAYPAIPGSEAAARPRRDVAAILALPSTYDAARFTEPQFRLTCIITFYKRSQNVARYLDALAAQVHPCYEIWMCGWGSPEADAIAKNTRDWAAAHPAHTVKLVIGDPPLAFFGRFQMALQLDTPYVVFFDDDCVPGKLFTKLCMHTIGTTDYRGLLGVKVLLCVCVCLLWGGGSHWPYPVVCGCGCRDTAPSTRFARTACSTWDPAPCRGRFWRPMLWAVVGSSKRNGLSCVASFYPLSLSLVLPLFIFFFSSLSLSLSC